MGIIYTNEMKRFFTYIFALILPLMAMAQTEGPKNYRSIEIDPQSLAPVQTDALSGVPIDKIGLDRSMRPCARIKMHINRMTREDIAQLSVEPVGGVVEVMRQIVAYEGNGLIIELTAKPETRFYLRHPKFGDSNEVSFALEGDKEYRLNAQLCQMQSIVVSTNVVGADVYVDNQYRGKSNSGYTLTVNDIMVGQHKIRVEYGTLKREVEVLVTDADIYFKVEVDTQLTRPQYVVFQIVPVSASIAVGDKSYPLDSEGIAQMVLYNGSYNYIVSAKDYHDEKGTFVVSGAKVEKSVKLRPAHGFLSVSGEGALNGASVYVDGELLGTAPVKSDKLASGNHSVRIVKSLYKTFDGKVVIEDGKTLDYAPTLVADFATVSLSAGSDCDIYINNERVGKGSWRGDLATGAYIFEARKVGHRSTSVSKNITATPSEQNYTIPTPSPILGTLNVTSDPALADVYVDGKSAGRTPLMVDLIIGSHEVELRKGDLATKKQSVNIEEGKTADLNLTLTKLSKDYVETAAGINMKMVYVEGGTFQMGSNAGDSDETPVHSVTLDSYYIAECEVTQAQWQTIMGDNPSKFTGDTNRPVESVSWEEAKAFCAKLSELTGKRYTLPTEAQWEYAARGGNKSQGYTYSGSNTIDDVAWYRSDSSSTTHAVKQKSANELGLYDMSGNVWEWCNDWYGSSYYSSSPQTNPTGPSSGSYRVIRGGGWGDTASGCRVANRYCNAPSGRYGGVGFRVVCLDGEAVDGNEESNDTIYHTLVSGDNLYKLAQTYGITINKICELNPDLDPSTLRIGQRIRVRYGTKPKHQTFIETAAGINMKMVYVEGGTFQMGSNAGESDEKPVHSVTLDSYYIAECEVTQAQWQKIMGNNPSNFTGDTNRPVECVSWEDATSFCAKLSELTGKRYTLPTEAQWEYAARGGNKSQGYKYSGSNTISDVAWYEDNSSRTTHAVKQKSANELGLYDMSGNVREWCNDWYNASYYSSSPQTNPTGPSSGSYRVIRGGSWYNAASICRVAYRGNNAPSNRFSIVGFRVVCLP